MPASLKKALYMFPLLPVVLLESQRYHHTQAMPGETEAQGCTSNFQKVTHGGCGPAFCASN